MGGNQRKGWLVLLLAITTASAADQICREDIPASAPDSRFTANGDGTVTDRATGLVWKQCAEGLSSADCLTGSATTFTWWAALQHAADQIFAGSSLWRLPNKNELASLVERSCYNPAINSRFFPNTPSDWFWSSSPDAYLTSRAWHVKLDNGNVSYNANKSNAHYVLLVRGGQ